MPEYVICWWNCARGEREYEEFDSLDAAEAELASWEKSYPWNTYFLAEVKRRVIATRPPPPTGWSVSEPQY